MRMFPKLGRGAGRYKARMDTTMFERATYADLLRGVQMGRYAGLYTVNEGRKLLGEQPYTEKQANSKDPADKLWMPVNMSYVSMDVTGTSDDGSDQGEGQGGNDQGGGDGGGKPAKPATQGGKRELEHYFCLFYPTFRDALGRISGRKKVNEADFQKAFGPVLIQIASAFSLRADATPEEFTLSEPIQHFLRDYAGKLSRRMNLKSDLDEEAKEELRKALSTLREACQPLPGEQSGVTVSNDYDTEVIELLIKPEQQNITMPITLHRARKRNIKVIRDKTTGAITGAESTEE
jgi:hypothetical protein